jgi:hypothetical protein
MTGALLVAGIDQAFFERASGHSTSVTNNRRRCCSGESAATDTSRASVDSRAERLGQVRRAYSQGWRPNYSRVK